MTKQFIAVLAAACLLSCNTVPKTEVLDLPSVRPSEIYENNSVVVFINKHHNKNEKIAATYFEKGQKLEDENREEAIWNYKRAITLHPTLDYYHTLGDILIKDKNDKEAANLYAMLVSEYNIQDEHGWHSNHIFGSPSEDDVFKYLLSNLLQYNYLDPYELSRVVDNGYDLQKMKKRLFGDERFMFDTSGIVYKELSNMFLTDDEAAAYASNPDHFKSFISRIKDTSASYEITTNTVSDFVFNGQYAWDETGRGLQALEMLFLKQKQDNSDKWYMYNIKNTARVNDSVLYVIYSIDTSEYVCPKPMRHIDYTLATYTNAGKMIDAKPLAWQAGDLLAAAKVNKGQIEINAFKRSWKKPYNKADFDNELVSTTAVKSYFLKIQDDGKIVEVLQ
ncbi:MAG: hypothetical protein V4658_10110 [Bacteroidota bacterium]